MGIFTLGQSFVRCEPDMRPYKVVLVICKHRIQIVLIRWRIVEIRACKLLVLKVYLAVCTSSFYQRVWRQTEVCLHISEIKTLIPVLVDHIWRHMGLETLLNHWSAVLELMQEAFISMLPPRLRFERRSTNRVGHRTLYKLVMPIKIIVLRWWC
jgi:hypothetical protein